MQRCVPLICSFPLRAVSARNPQGCPLFCVQPWPLCSLMLQATSREKHAEMSLSSRQLAQVCGALPRPFAQFPRRGSAGVRRRRVVATSFGVPVLQIVPRKWSA
jgi:hypothetical protein